MPREYQRKTIGTYDHSKLMTAIQLVKEGESVYSVSKSSGIPYGTLYRRSHDQIQRNDKKIGSGRGFVLNNTKENLLVEALMYLADKGFPQDREDIKLMVKSYITFIVLGKRKPELLTKARANDLSLKTLTDFFELYEKTLNNNNLFDRPHCIFNLDETGLRTDPTAGKIFFRITSKTAYYIAPSCGKSMYTLLFCGSANGQCLPPFVVYKAIYLYDAWCQNGPENAMYGDYEKPVLLLCDGHNSRITYSTVKKALDNHIILICLPPNTSHALQPLDVGFLAPLKSHWKKILKD
ncbi:uncharacterized protein LOC136085412 [Hydra vulgaris]|uniref:Uncharacterized protein LOC136085412 n=1 Tax=Hydra vulgaris TaxID=6087 RepID=A0ABM4CLY3_HYDVU